MKKLFLIISLFFANIIFAQFEPVQMTPDDNFILCNTSGSSTNMSEMEAIRNLDHSNDIFYVKLYIHVIKDGQDPKSGQSIEGVNRMVKTLYDDYDPLGIHFVWDGEIDYIENFVFYILPYHHYDDIFSTNNHADGIDIYIHDDRDASGFALVNQGVGVSTELLIGGFYYAYELTPLSWTKYLSHEIGHILYLWHTHHGTYIPITDNEPDENGDDPNACQELVNGSNGTTCGDYIADTPADPNIKYFNTNPNTCEFVPLPDSQLPLIDANTEPYQPDTGNIMSYTYPTCYDGFTEGQKTRMKNALSYLPVLNSTLLTDYTYIRAQNDCFVCFGNETHLFTVYSSLDASILCPISSDNVETEIIASTSNSITLKITSLIGDVEGERGYFKINNCNTNEELVVQELWVGKPQTIPDGDIWGDETSIPNEQSFHRLNDRLDGINYYGWEFPEPNEIVWGGEQLNTEVWQHYGLDKYFLFSYGFPGNQTGIVRVRGINPCGEGGFGDDNEICVVNTEDEDTTCEEPDPFPILYYPNPANSLLEIDLSLQTYKVYTVTIYDETQTVKYSDQTTNIIKSVDVFNLINGTYYLHIYDNNNTPILERILIINH